MNTTEQAKNSFKTFIVTLTVAMSLLVAAYYFVTDLSANIEIEDDVAASPSVESVENELAVNTDVDQPAEVQGASVFKDLAEKEPEPQGAVLQAADDFTLDDDFSSLDNELNSLTADTTTNTTNTTATNDTNESTIPETGTTETTMALLMSIAILGFGGYVLGKGPRNQALRSFENRVKDQL